MALTPLTSALISVYHKDGLEPIVRQLHTAGVVLYSTGGTRTFLEQLGLPVTGVEEITGYPDIFGGRVKTLHPAVFGGILYRRGLEGDEAQARQHQIKPIDLVIVDLYPFEETVAGGGSAEDIIEKIDIGGISLIRAAAKNFAHTLIVSSRAQYARLQQLLETNGAATTLDERRAFATQAFATSSHYDAAIFNWFAQPGASDAGAANGGSLPEQLRITGGPAQVLRYGENPHQRGVFYGQLDQCLQQLHGKELSYNNLVDADAAINLINEFDPAQGCTFAIIKHTNACGVATAATPAQAYVNALAADPVSAFGGVIATNQPLDLATAEELNKLFFEILIAPGYEPAALDLLKSKKNRMLLVGKNTQFQGMQVKSLLNGYLVQDRDDRTESLADLQTVTETAPTAEQAQALLFAAKVCKHTKSNTIVLARNGQLLASGTGQTSRVDALKQAIEKARNFGFDLAGAVMASDAFFPFADCVQIAHEAGIAAMIQPGGSVRDADSISYCNNHSLAMVFTGLRHFKH